jgi:hypothetical protein
MPWSVPLIIIGGFASHSFSDVDFYLDIMKIFAVLLNVVVYLALLKRFAAEKSSTALTGK